MLDITDIEHDIRAGRLRDEMSFNQKVWAVTARIPKGCVTTYAEIARALGSKGYRAVGNALNKNPYAPQVPCHRVVGSNGKLTGFAGGLDLKTTLLASEGIDVKDGRTHVESFFRFSVQALRRSSCARMIDHMGNVIFETARLIVRQYTEADAEQALVIYGDPEVMRFLGNGKTAPVENVEQMRRTLIERRIKRYEPNPQLGAWAAVSKDTGRIVGTIILLNLDTTDEIEVGWHLARSAWGNGYATEGGRAAIEHGFSTVGLDRIACVAHPDNHRSQAVARRLNLKHEGRRHFYEQDLDYFSAEKPQRGSAGQREDAPDGRA